MQHNLNDQVNGLNNGATSYRRLRARGKATQVVVVAIARELVAFMWAIARRVPAVA